MNNDRMNRRDIVSKATLGAVATTAAGILPAESQPTMNARPLNPGAKAVLSDGSLADRAQILSKLGLNPNTPPDAWLAVVACGSNAAALNAEMRRSITAKLKAQGITVDK